MTHINFWLLAVITLLVPQTSSAQSTAVLKGRVLSAEEEAVPLTGANIVWLGSKVGVASDIDGYFQIDHSKEDAKLVISYIGYQTDTIAVDNHEFLTVNLREGNVLEDVEVVHRRKATEISFLDPAKVENINEKELLKAACCNLSESFETSPSVDVAFTDAVTGTRQIQMLGLAGPYIQITRESMPYIRGLSSIYGLTFVPGTWVQSMQLNKGAGTVVNGFESIAGQINIELRKPEDSDRMYLNLYANESARLEGNLNFTTKVNDKWSTALLLHGKTNRRKMDRNDDGFLDNPLSNHIIALNRWKYVGDNGIRMQFGISGTHIENIGGQNSFDEELGRENTEVWGMKMDIERLEGWFKMGKVYEDIPWRSWALQLSASSHKQNSFFGLRDYNATQGSLYANLLYQTIIGNTNHQTLMGFSFQHDDYSESFASLPFDRTESVPGTFFEYTYGGHEKFSIVAGIRADYHNVFGLFATPRLHLRYAFNDQIVWRASAGRGQRTANILAESAGLMASARTFIITGDGSNKPFGLDPEVAWNIGTNVVYSFQSGQHPGTISFDLYRTAFTNQIIIDLDKSAQEAHFYNLDGQSYSNSFQAQIDYEVARGFDARLAYRWYDVKSTYSGKLLEKPLTSKHRLFLNLAYATKNHWSFDYTINWQGPKRLPSTINNPEQYQLDDYSPSFIVMNAQVSKSWGDKFELYMGVENLLDYKQENPILASEDPFGAYFDSSLTWGPIFGRNTYLGLRYRI